MPITRRIAALILAAALSMPAAALAQTPTAPMPGKGSGASRPPVDLSAEEEGSNDSGSPSATRSSELPDTGSDPRMLILAGAALTLLGVGLRLRTADADLY